MTIMMGPSDDASTTLTGTAASATEQPPPAEQQWPTDQEQEEPIPTNKNNKKAVEKEDVHYKAETTMMTTAIMHTEDGSPPLPKDHVDPTNKEKEEPLPEAAAALNMEKDENEATTTSDGIFIAEGDEEHDHQHQTEAISKAEQDEDEEKEKAQQKTTATTSSSGLLEEEESNGKDIPRPMEGSSQPAPINTQETTESYEYNDDDDDNDDPDRATTTTGVTFERRDSAVATVVTNVEVNNLGHVLHCMPSSEDLVETVTSLSTSAESSPKAGGSVGSVGEGGGSSLVGGGRGGAAGLSEATAASMNVTDASNLAANNRKICIVTTAALPWRTGTAVNPMLRALALMDHHDVLLMIPWLESKQARDKLYGTEHVFENCQEQEAWIRKYCVERCNCQDVTKLQIQFYPGTYQDSFGSIFPTSDICNDIPDEFSDVCILEEPEHLNWFRVVPTSNSPKSKKTTTAGTTSGGGSAAEVENNNSSEEGGGSYGTNNNNKIQHLLGWKMKFQHVIGILHTNYADYVRQYGMGVSMVTAPALNSLSALVVKAYCHRVIRLSATLPKLDPSKEITCNVHGVRDEFFIKDPSSHTATSIVTAKDTKPANSPTTTSGKQNEKTEQQGDKSEDDEEETLAPVYFIGKLIWAKGFENVLRLQAKYKHATGQYFKFDVYGGGKDQEEIQTTFHGYRHKYRYNQKRSASSVSESSADKRATAVLSATTSLRDQICGRTVEAVADAVVAATNTATTTVGSAVKDATWSSLASSSQSAATTATTADTTINTAEAPPPTPIATDTKNTTITTPPRAASSTSPSSPSSCATDTPTPSANFALFADDDDDINDNGEDEEDDDLDDEEEKKDESNPFGEVLGDLGDKTFSTSVETADAALKLIDSVVSFGLEDDDDDDDDVREEVPQQEEQRQQLLQPRRAGPGGIGFHIAPIRARYKWRKTPMPARFLGVKDHIVIRDIPEHKIFLNMSTSEVLCTTSAEALAMEKFVILPKHPSNEFFLQFPNCLAYETIDQCVLKLQYAMENTPEKLSETHRHMLSWEGATERLIKASAITQREAAERQAKGLDLADLKSAKFHVEAAKRSHYIGNFLRDKILK